MISEISKRIEDLVSVHGATELTRLMGISFGALKSMRAGRDRIDGSSAIPIIEMIENGASEDDLQSLDDADAVQEIKRVMMSGRISLKDFADLAGISRFTAQNWMSAPSPRSKRTRVAYIRSLGRQLSEGADRTETA